MHAGPLPVPGYPVSILGVREAVGSFSLVYRSPEGNFTGHSAFTVPDTSSADFKRARSMTKTISCAWGEKPEID